MSQIDNRPQWLTLKYFRRQLLKFMVEDCDYIAEELDEQLKKSTHSYKDICMRLARAQKPGDAIHMIVSAASLMLNIPILMVFLFNRWTEIAAAFHTNTRKCLPVLHWHIRSEGSIPSN